MTVALLTEADANPGEAEYLASLGVQPGQVVEVRSGSGRIHTVAEADETLRPGVASTSHRLSNLPGTDDDPIAFGASPGPLLSLPVDIEDTDGMPRMSAVPMPVTPLQPDARAAVLLPSATGR